MPVGDCLVALSGIVVVQGVTVGVLGERDQSHPGIRHPSDQQTPITRLFSVADQMGGTHEGRVVCILGDAGAAGAGVTVTVAGVETWLPDGLPGLPGLRAGSG
jgi:hypothetical protein